MNKPHVVIVGGGPTGIELSGTLGEITRFSLTKDFDHINPQETRIILVEAGPRILPTMTEELSTEAVRELTELGVEVRVNSRVLDVNERGIQVGDEFIETSTILWAAGVAANLLNKKLDVELDRQGRIIVNRVLAIPSHPEIFVIGDQAHYEWVEDKKPLPGLAPVAIQQGRFVARYLKKKINHRPVPEYFKYVDKGQMATIGRSRAVAMFQGLQMHGFIAWMAWLVVHIWYLIGFKNRIFVLFQWAWTYLTFRRGARLIIDEIIIAQAPETETSDKLCESFDRAPHPFETYNDYSANHWKETFHALAADSIRNHESINLQT